MNNPRLETVDDGFRVIVPFAYEWKIDGTRYRLTVPSGFRPDGTPWNGCSTPRIVWPILGRDGKRHRAAWLLHDLLYYHGGKVGNLHERLDTSTKPPLWKQVHRDWTRNQSDRLFLRVCREGGLNKAVRRIAYRALVWFGRGSWRG